MGIRAGDLEHMAIARLKTAAELSESYYENPLLLAYSGGKDSEVCLELCRRAGIPFEVSHSLTTADAPETVWHVKRVFRRLELEGIRCEVLYPEYKGRRVSMWTLIPQKLMPPTRVARYCCSVCKERSGRGRMMALGVRRFESQSRGDSGPAETQGKSRKDREIFDFDNGDGRMFVHCMAKQKIKVHPIVEWTDRDVWDFLRDAKAELNPCYSMGFSRVGCVGCPMAGKGRWKEFRQWPKYEVLYRRAFERMLVKRRELGKPCQWRTGEEVFRWWMEDRNLDGQMGFFENERGEEENGA